MSRLLPSSRQMKHPKPYSKFVVETHVLDMNEQKHRGYGTYQEPVLTYLSIHVPTYLFVCLSRHFFTYPY